MRWTSAGRAVGIWVPIFSPSLIPLDVPAGVRLRERLPDRGLHGRSVGAKLDRSGGQLDASLAYYYGCNLLPEIRLCDIKSINEDFNSAKNLK